MSTREIERILGYMFGSVKAKVGGLLPETLIKDLV